LVKCGVCGGNVVVISKNLFGCARARDQGTCANRINVRRDMLEETVLEGFKTQLMDPKLFERFAEEFYRELNRARSRRGARSSKRNASASPSQTVYRPAPSETSCSASKRGSNSS